MMIVKGNSQITWKPMWLFEQPYHRDEYIRENTFPLYGTLLFLLPVWFYYWFCQFKLLPFGPHLIFYVLCIYIYISFASWNEVITQFLDPLCGNLSQHVISRSEIKICQENLFHWNTQTEKKNFFELGSINESVRPVARQYETLWFIFFSFKADLRQSVLSY